MKVISVELLGWALTQCGGALLGRVVNPSLMKSTEFLLPSSLLPLPNTHTEARTVHCFYFFIFWSEAITVSGVCLCTVQALEDTKSSTHKCSIGVSATQSR